MAKSLSQPAFVFFVIALFISTSGTWMFSAGAGWLMTDLGASDLMVALSQAAVMAPVIFFALPAGAVGDLFNRRRLLLITQFLLIANVSLMAWMVASDHATPWRVLLLTFVGGTVGVFARPTLNAVIPTLVGRDQVASAVNIKSVAFNLARAIGPALAGGLVGWFGLSAPFWADGITFLAVVAFLFWWDGGQKKKNDLPPERFGQAVRAAVRFVRYDPALRATLMRTVLAFLSAGALWALMPLVAKRQLDGGAVLYGGLLGAAGCGAVVTGLLARRVTKRTGPNALVAAAGVLLGVAYVGLAWSPNVPAGVAAAFLGGCGWQGMFAATTASAQTALPDWIGARGMAMYQGSFFASVALSSLLAGLASTHLGLDTALLAAAGLSVLLAPIGLKFKLAQAQGEDLSLVDSYPTPAVDLTDAQKAGPVQVQIEYDLGDADTAHAADTAEVAAAIRQMRERRLRTGAYDWQLLQQPDNDRKLVETFMTADWTEHAREVERITHDDDQAMQHICDLLEPAGGTRQVSYLVAPG